MRSSAVFNYSGIRLLNFCEGLGTAAALSLTAARAFAAPRTFSATRTLASALAEYAAFARSDELPKRGIRCAVFGQGPLVMPLRAVGHGRIDHQLVAFHLARGLGVFPDTFGHSDFLALGRILAQDHIAIGLGLLHVHDALLIGQLANLAAFLALPGAVELRRILRHQQERGYAQGSDRHQYCFLHRVFPADGGSSGFSHGL